MIVIVVWFEKNKEKTPEGQAAFLRKSVDVHRQRLLVSKLTQPRSLPIQAVPAPACPSGKNNAFG